MSHTPLTHHDIVVGLQQLGVVRGATLEVHSSLSAFGWVAGGAATVLEAVMDVVGPDGTIVMSAYPVSPVVPLTDEDHARGITWKARKLSLDSSEPTSMGIIADTFRQRPDVVCGNGFFRTCAWGRDAEWHCTGYYGLLAVDGRCVLLGVGIDSCSSMHAAEYIPLPAYVRLSSCSHHSVTPTTLFQAASLTKPLFAYAVLQLCDTGLLDLDTPCGTAFFKCVECYAHPTCAGWSARTDTLGLGLGCATHQPRRLCLALGRPQNGYTSYASALLKEQRGVVVLTNSDAGLPACEVIAEAALAVEQPAFAWLLPVKYWRPEG